MTFIANFSYPPSISANSVINAMDFQPGTGTLFGSVAQPGVLLQPAGGGTDGVVLLTSPNLLATINTTTAAVTLIGTGTQAGLDAIAFTPAVVSTPASITATGGTPQSAIVNHAFGLPLQATVKDSSSNPIAGVTVTFTAPGTGASGSFAGGVNTAVTNASGVATSVIFTANTTVGGPYNVAATTVGVATPANFALTNTPGPPAQIAATGGTPQSAVISTAFASSLQATVKDSFGNVVPGVTVTFTTPGSGASGTFAGGANTAVTNSSGVATSATFTANATTGSYSVTATFSSGASPELAALTAITNGFTTSATFSLKNVDYAVVPTTTTQTVTAGGTANYSLTFTTVVGNSVNPTTFSCQGLPALSSCTFTPASIPANSPNTPFTLAISTTAPGHITGIGPTNVVGRPFQKFVRPELLGIFAMLALMLSIVAIPKRVFGSRRNFARLRSSAVSVFGFAALLLLTSYISGCSGGNSGFPIGGSSPGTPAGTYTITIVGTEGTAQRTTTVTLIVQ
jgi:hypothetical protein